MHHVYTVWHGKIQNQPAEYAKFSLRASHLPSNIQLLNNRNYVRIYIQHVHADTLTIALIRKLLFIALVLLFPVYGSLVESSFFKHIRMW